MFALSLGDKIKQNNPDHPGFLREHFYVEFVKEINSDLFVLLHRNRREKSADLKRIYALFTKHTSPSLHCLETR
jgi:hypothetical protein